MTKTAYIIAFLLLTVSFLNVGCRKASSEEGLAEPKQVWSTDIGLGDPTDGTSAVQNATAIFVNLGNQLVAVRKTDGQKIWNWIGDAGQIVATGTNLLSLHHNTGLNKTIFRSFDPQTGQLRWEQMLVGLDAYDIAGEIAGDVYVLVLAPQDLAHDCKVLLKLNGTNGTVDTAFQMPLGKQIVYPVVGTAGNAQPLCWYIEATGSGDDYRESAVAYDLTNHTPLWSQPLGSKPLADDTNRRLWHRKNYVLTVEPDGAEKVGAHCLLSNDGAVKWQSQASAYDFLWEQDGLLFDPSKHGFDLETGKQLFENKSLNTFGYATLVDHTLSAVLDGVHYSVVSPFSISGSFGYSEPASLQAFDGKTGDLLWNAKPDHWHHVYSEHVFFPIFTDAALHKVFLISDSRVVCYEPR